MNPGKTCQLPFKGGLPDNYHCTVGENASLPKVYKDGKWHTDKCRMYNVTLTSPYNVTMTSEYNVTMTSPYNATTPCTDGWTYYDSTIVMELGYNSLGLVAQKLTTR